MRAFLERLFRLVLRIFFRDIEVVGEDQVPREAPVVYVSNHPNALLDPIFLLCLSPRRVSFLAKEPLFRTPVVSHLVKAFDSLPVYRKVDGANPQQNRATIDACRAALDRGQAIALFPEGTTHSDPQLKPLKSGAARIALSANASGARSGDVSIVPAGLYYSDKRSFRSRASLVYGEPLSVPLVDLDENAEPPRAAAAELTERIDRALAQVTVQAGSREALALAEAAERIFAAAERDEAGGEAQRASRVFDEMDLRRRLIDGYEALRVARPAEVEALAARVREYDARIERHGLSHRHSSRLTVGVVLEYTVSSVLGLLALAPFALPGWLINYPAYRLIGFLTTRAAEEEEVVATYKVLGALLLFPFSWLLCAAVVYWQTVPLLGLGALLLCPVAAFAALVFVEKLLELVRGARLLFLSLLRPSQRDLLVRERRTIRDEILRLADALAGAAESTPDATAVGEQGDEKNGTSSP